ncbi:MAG: hypothetical protein IPM60_17170 [Rhodospirillales bacterium]|nr:hypothetical protein [Rhodospirillales bacterium]
MLRDERVFPLEPALRAVRFANENVPFAALPRCVQQDTMRRQQSPQPAGPQQSKSLD